MTTKSAVAFLLLNLALFAFVSANATCPDLSVCVQVGGDLLNVQFSSQTKTDCCQLIKNVIDADLLACLCTNLKSTATGTLGGAAVSGLLGPIAGGLLGTVTNILGGLTGDLLQKEFLAVVNGCGYTTSYQCV